MKKDLLCTAAGAMGAAVTSLLGGWNSAITTLMLFMVIDYLSGLVVAGIFKNSTKTTNGALKSSVGWKGLCRKGMTLLIVLVAHRLDIAIGTSYIRDATVIAFVMNESLSIVENAGLMGVPIPRVVTKAIDVLRNKEEEANEN